jgi:hypothetical protein
MKNKLILDLTEPDDELFCNPRCGCLVPTEAQQTRQHEEHRCKKYNQVLKHRKAHPRLYKCDICLQVSRIK